MEVFGNKSYVYSRKHQTPNHTKHEILNSPICSPLGIAISSPFGKHLNGEYVHSKPSFINNHPSIGYLPL